MTVFLDLTKMTKQEVATVGDMTIHTKAGVVHRDDGPAIVTSWSQEWFVNGTAHRADGPAKVYLNHPVGGKYIAEWYENGKYYHQEQYKEHERDAFMAHWHKE